MPRHLELLPGMKKRVTKPHTDTDKTPIQPCSDLEERVAQLNHDLEETLARVTRNLEEKVVRVNCNLEDTVARANRNLAEQCARMNRNLEDTVTRANRKLSETSAWMSDDLEMYLRIINRNMKEKFLQIRCDLEQIAIRVNHDLEEKAAEIISGLSPSALHSELQPHVSTISPAPTHNSTNFREPTPQVAKPKPKEEVEPKGPVGKPPLKPTEADGALCKKALRDTNTASALKCTPEKKLISIESFEFHKVLGKGNFGKVLLAELKDSGEYFAIKALKKEKILAHDNRAYTMAEKRVLALACDSPYLLHLYSTFQTKEYLFFVMECLNGGDLMLNMQQTGPFDLGRATFYAAEMICGIQFLHSRGIIHRDLKLENVMLDKDGHIKIIDFGLCKENMFGGKWASNFCGTANYMAPEIIKGWKYSFPVDWWSFGVVVFVMLNGMLPFHGMTERELFKSIRKTTPQCQFWLSVEAKDLLEKLLERDPYYRLGVVGNIRTHPFFNSIDWAALERREVKPPFQPKVKHPTDFSNLRQDLLHEKPHLSNSDQKVIDSIGPEVFAGFSFINPKWRCS